MDLNYVYNTSSRVYIRMNTYTIALSKRRKWYTVFCIPLKIFDPIAWQTAKAAPNTAIRSTFIIHVLSILIITHSPPFSSPSRNPVDPWTSSQSTVLWLPNGAFDIESCFQPNGGASFFERRLYNDTRKMNIEQRQKKV